MKEMETVSSFLPAIVNELHPESKPNYLKRIIATTNYREVEEWVDECNLVNHPLE